MKKIVKKTPMKKGGNVKKAFLGSLLGGAGGGGMLGGLLGGGGGGMLGGLLGGGGGKGGAEGGGMGKISKMFGGSMKKGGKVVAKKKAKTGTSLGMKSVKAGVDKNPRVTRADIITAATKKARSGTSVKKAQDGETMIGNAGAMRKTKMKERSPDGNYVVKRVTRTTPDGEKTTQKVRRSVQGFLKGAPKVSTNKALKGVPNRFFSSPDEMYKNGGSTKKAKSGGSMKKCRYGCK